MTIAPTSLRTRRAIASLAATLAAATVAVSIGGGTAAAASGEQTIVKTAADAGQFDTLLSLAKKAGLVGALSGNGPLTVFAPTDAAFERVPRASINALAKDRAALRRVLLYHVVKGNVPAARVVELRSTKTLAGPTIAIRVNGNSVFLNRSAKIVKTDIAATNGTIHVINKVLLPPTR